MYVLTMQDKSILEDEREIITHNGKINYTNALPCYELMESDFYYKTKEPVEHLFWGMSQLNGLPVSLNETCMKDFLNVQSFNHLSNKVFLLLDIPEEELLLTDYYAYTTQLCKYDGSFDDIEDPWESVHQIDEYTDHIQAVFASIKRTQIVDYFFN